MIRLSSFAIATAVAAFLLAGPASAQTAAPAPAAKSAPMAKPAPMTAPAPKAKAERTAASLDCSKQADAKGLHGKERKKFRSACKKGGAKAN